jgi:tetratricopeptide (TPR) repeat protein
MRPAIRHDDAISLNTPVGAPTPKLFIAAAQLCESHGDNNLARANYQEAMNKWPGDVEVLRAAARMEDRMGQLAIAENLYAKAVTANPGHAGALNDLGLCLARQGKLEASVQVLEQAINIRPDKALYRNNAATVLVEMRQDKRALAHLANVHGAADANYNFGQLLVQRNRAADATPYFQAAIDQNPEMQHARVALGKLRGDAGSTTTSFEPAVSQPQTPAAQQTAPVAAPDNGPQLGYPATAARTNSSAIQNNVPARYLPPVASRPGSIQR